MANKFHPISQQERLFLLYKLLRNTTLKTAISFEDITKYLYAEHGIEVHPNTIHNDLTLLKSLYILPELEYDRKKKGYYNSKPLFDPDEIRLLVDSIQSTSFITQNKAEDLTKKIKTLTDTKTASTLNRTAYVSGRTRSQNDRIIKETDEIYKAIATDRKLIFRYAKYTMEKKNGIYVKESSLRTVSPFALLWEKGKLYLYAYDEKRFRTYRVDRMESAKVHPTEMRTAKEEYKKTNLTKPTVKVFEMYDAPASIVRIRFRKELADAVIDQFGKDVMMIPQDEEHFTISVPVAVSPTFFAWIATFGHKAKIVEPAPVVEKMRDFLQRCSDMYLD